MSAALALWRRSSCRRVLTPEPVGVELCSGGLTAVDAWRRDPGRRRARLAAGDGGGAASGAEGA